MFQPIVYEDENFLIAEKKIEHTVPLKNQVDKNTLLDAVAEHYPEVYSVKGKKYWEGSALHRLDYETTGLVLFARNQRFYDFITEVQSKGKFIKKYHAVTDPAYDGKTTVKSYFRAFGPGRVKVKAEYSEKKADTSVVYETKVVSKGSYVECFIAKGFRHQIRVHLMELGCPIVGDKLYNEKKYNQNLQLRCVELEFPLYDGEIFKFSIEA